MKRAPSLRAALGFSCAFGALSGVALPACSEDGATPDCPSVPLYDIGAAGERNDAEPARKAAVTAGCLTDIDRTDTGATR